MEIKKNRERGIVKAEQEEREREREKKIPWMRKRANDGKVREAVIPLFEKPEAVNNHGNPNEIKDCIDDLH